MIVGSHEPEEVRRRYARRLEVVAPGRYDPLLPANWMPLQERQRAILRALARAAIRDVSQLRLIEVGCGAGGNLLEFLRLGFSPGNLSGVELLPERAQAARQVLPAAVRITTGDAATHQVAPASADIVFQAVVFSSLLDAAFQAQLAAQMWRWLRPGGGVLWYDFTWNNPRNPDVQGVPLARVRELFPEGEIRSERVTLAPPIARLVTRWHPGLYTLLNAVPLLRTHLLCWIRKP